MKKITNKVVEETKISGPFIPLKTSPKTKRPKTAFINSARTKKASWFQKKKDESDSDVSSESSSKSSKVSKNSDIKKTPKMPLTRGVGSTKQNTRKNKAVKRGFVIVSHKLIEIHNNKPLATPQISKRSLLMSGGNDENNNANEKKPVLQQYTFQNSNHTQKKEKVQKSKPNKIQPKMQNFMMTPSQNLVHSRKLLQMKTVGVSNQITDSKVKEEDDIKNMKPSSEFFCKLDYVNQLKEDKHGINTWEKSFGDAINEVNIQNKEYLEWIDRTIQRRFAKTPGLWKKTVVFGLDGVLVKTNFEKDKEDWKPATLILNENTGSKITIYVSIRPFVINTLRQLKRAGIELVLYSSSQYNYTSAILDILIKQKIEFHHIIWSEDHDKILNPDGKLSKRTVITKNINILLHNRNEKDIIFCRL